MSAHDNAVCLNLSDLATASDVVLNPLPITITNKPPLPHDHNRVSVSVTVATKHTKARIVVSREASPNSSPQTSPKDGKSCLPSTDNDALVPEPSRDSRAHIESQNTRFTANSDHTANNNSPAPRTPPACLSHVRPLAGTAGHISGRRRHEGVPFADALGIFAGGKKTHVSGLQRKSSLPGSPRTGKVGVRGLARTFSDAGTSGSQGIGGGQKKPSRTPRPDVVKLIKRFSTSEDQLNTKLNKGKETETSPILTTPPRNQVAASPAPSSFDNQSRRWAYPHAGQHRQSATGRSSPQSTKSQISKQKTAYEIKTLNASQTCGPHIQPCNTSDNSCVTRHNNDFTPSKEQTSQKETFPDDELEDVEDWSIDQAEIDRLLEKSAKLRRARRQGSLQSDPPTDRPQCPAADLHSPTQAHGDTCFVTEGTSVAGSSSRCSDDVSNHGANTSVAKANVTTKHEGDTLLKSQSSMQACSSQSERIALYKEQRKKQLAYINDRLGVDLSGKSETDSADASNQRLSSQESTETDDSSERRTNSPRKRTHSWYVSNFEWRERSHHIPGVDTEIKQKQPRKIIRSLTEGTLKLDIDFRRRIRSSSLREQISSQYAAAQRSSSPSSRSPLLTAGDAADPSHDDVFTDVGAPHHQTRQRGLEGLTDVTAGQPVEGTTQFTAGDTSRGIAGHTVRNMTRDMDGDMLRYTAGDATSDTLGDQEEATPSVDSLVLEVSSNGYQVSSDGYPVSSDADGYQTASTGELHSEKVESTLFCPSSSMGSCPPALPHWTDDIASHSQQKYADDTLAQKCPSQEQSFTSQHIERSRRRHTDLQLSNVNGKLHKRVNSHDDLESILTQGEYSNSTINSEPCKRLHGGSNETRSQFLIRMSTPKYQKSPIKTIHGDGHSVTSSPRKRVESNNNTKMQSGEDIRTSPRNDSTALYKSQKQSPREQSNQRYRENGCTQHIDMQRKRANENRRPSWGFGGKILLKDKIVVSNEDTNRQDLRESNEKNNILQRSSVTRASLPSCVSSLRPLQRSYSFKENTREKNLLSSPYLSNKRRLSITARLHDLKKQESKAHETFVKIIAKNKECRKYFEEAEEETVQDINNRQCNVFKQDGVQEYDDTGVDNHETVPSSCSSSSGAAPKPDKAHRQSTQHRSGRTVLAQSSGSTNLADCAPYYDAEVQAMPDAVEVNARRIELQSMICLPKPSPHEPDVQPTNFPRTSEEHSSSLSAKEESTDKLFVSIEEAPSVTKLNPPEVINILEDGSTKSYEVHCPNISAKVPDDPKIRYKKKLYTADYHSCEQKTTDNVNTESISSRQTTRSPHGRVTKFVKSFEDFNDEAESLSISGEDQCYKKTENVEMNKLEHQIFTCSQVDNNNQSRARHAEDQTQQSTNPEALNGPQQPNASHPQYDSQPQYASQSTHSSQSPSSSQPLHAFQLPYAFQPQQESQSPLAPHSPSTPQLAQASQPQEASQSPQSATSPHASQLQYKPPQSHAPVPPHAPCQNGTQNMHDLDTAKTPYGQCVKDRVLAFVGDKHEVCTSPKNLVQTRLTSEMHAVTPEAPIVACQSTIVDSNLNIAKPDDGVVCNKVNFNHLSNQIGVNGMAHKDEHLSRIPESIASKASGLENIKNLHNSTSSNDGFQSGLSNKVRGDSTSSLFEINNVSNLELEVNGVSNADDIFNERRSVRIMDTIGIDTNSEMSKIKVKSIIDPSRHSLSEKDTFNSSVNEMKVDSESVSSAINILNNTRINNTSNLSPLLDETIREENCVRNTDTIIRVTNADKTFTESDPISHSASSLTNGDTVFGRTGVDSEVQTISEKVPSASKKTSTTGLCDKGNTILKSAQGSISDDIVSPTCRAPGDKVFFSSSMSDDETRMPPKSCNVDEQVLSPKQNPRAKNGKLGERIRFLENLINNPDTAKACSDEEGSEQNTQSIHTTVEHQQKAYDDNHFAGISNITNISSDQITKYNKASVPSSVQIPKYSSASVSTDVNKQSIASKDYLLIQSVREKNNIASTTNHEGYQGISGISETTSTVEAMTPNRVESLVSRLDVSFDSFNSMFIDNALYLQDASDNPSAIGSPVRRRKLSCNRTKRSKDTRRQNLGSESPQD